MASLTLRPGVRVRLKGQDPHVPDFYVVGYDHDYCWIRQRSWGAEALLHVPFAQIVIPDETRQVSPAPSLAAGQTFCMSATVRGASVPSQLPQREPLPAPFPNYSNVVFMATYRRRKAR